MSHQQTPDKQFRPAPFWSWNDQLRPAELLRQIAEMDAKGYGGFFMHARVGLVTPYLSDEWMEAIAACADEADRRGLQAWLYDEDKWPSGFAGGAVPAADRAHLQRALVLARPDQVTDGDTVLREWEESGSRFLLCERTGPVGQVWFNGFSYTDLMNPRAVQFFFETTHNRYKKAVGAHFGKAIPGVFTDEPCYLFVDSYSLPAVPWSPGLPDYFRERCGYDLLPRLQELFFDTGEYRKTRFDFYESATLLFRDSFTIQYYNWCDDHRLVLTGHFMAEDDLVYQTQWIGAAMPHYARMHWPGIDKLGRHVDQLTVAKQLTSVTDQLGKPRALSEMFGASGAQVSFFHRKWMADFQAVLGINFANPHLSHYSLRGERKRDYPPNLFYQQPWWEDEGLFSEYHGRLCELAANGVRVVHALVLHPIGSVWSEYSPLHAKTEFAVEFGRYDKPWRTLSRLLMEQHLDFHYGDEILLDEYGHADGAQLVVGRHRYDTVIVPPVSTLKSTTVKQLQTFAQNGGQLIVIRPFPERIDGMPGAPDLSPFVACDSLTDAVQHLDQLCAERPRVFDRLSGKPANQVWIHMRKMDHYDVILLANTDSRRQIDIELRLPQALTSGTSLSLLDLADGQRYLLDRPIAEDGNIPLHLFPAGSAVITIDHESPSAAAPKRPRPSGEEIGPIILKSGATFKNGAAFESTALSRTAFDDPLVLRLNHFCITPQEANVLPLDRVTLTLGDHAFAPDTHLSALWHPHFYGAPDGAPFQAKYRFNVDELPIGDAFFAIEAAEHLDRIELNGHPLAPIPRPADGAFSLSASWKDVSLTRVPIESPLRLGENTLTLVGVKQNNITAPGCHVPAKTGHRPTELETVYLVGQFSVHGFDRQDWRISAPATVSNPFDWASSGYPFYAGSMVYATRFSYQPPPEPSSLRRALLQLSEVAAATVSVRVNGHEIGVRGWEPYWFDVTDALTPGDNSIEVTLTNSLVNLIGPRWAENGLSDRFIGPYHFLRQDRFDERTDLVRFGMGPARIIVRG